ncbi:EARP-interacting protein homolog [Coccinella septempunctata]|uniref:EARP-interacting protein homolog n=1 Tax=Coccinella septempunctata TaxID=41139 RepID=UPI001D091A91|nr:EARP-interacting protein homolog [Coccinella septempunctata]
MDNENSLIYGLEFQARALAPILAETEKLKFIIGTQSLKQSNNQIHLVEFNEEESVLKPQLFHHTEGEVWRITSSAVDASKIAVCYNSIIDESTCAMKSHVLKLPENYDSNIIDNLEVSNKLDIPSNDVKTTEFHPTNETRAASVTENKILLWDLSDFNARPISEIQLETKNNLKYSLGKWNPHQNCNQFSALTETHLKTYDVRTGDIAWSIDCCHRIFVRDIDYNMNKQYHIATCGDDSFLKIWDYRQTANPIFSRSDHTHWIWSVRFNPFHDQLILTASTDGRVLLSSAASVSSENVIESCLTEESNELEAKQILSDGPLQWCEHEDSVYCAEWSPAEPWIFASLSHDGRLLITRVKKSLKYQIML